MMETVLNEIDPSNFLVQKNIRKNEFEIEEKTEFY